MSAAYPERFLGPLPEQPLETDIRLLAGTFVKEARIAKAGTAVPQHSHTYAHVSVLVRGAVRLFKAEQHVGDFRAPCGLLIQALTKHMFLTLEDDTILLCVHDGEMDIAEEHALPFADPKA